MSDQQKFAQQLVNAAIEFATAIADEHNAELIQESADIDAIIASVPMPEPVGEYYDGQVHWNRIVSHSEHFEIFAAPVAQPAQAPEFVPDELSGQNGRYPRDYVDGFNRCRRETLARACAAQAQPAQRDADTVTLPKEFAARLHEALCKAQMFKLSSEISACIAKEAAE